MDTRAGAADLFHFLIIHFTDGICEGTGGIDDAFCLNIPFLLGQLISKGSTLNYFLPIRANAMDKFGDTNMVGHSCSMTGGSQSNSKAHSSIILLTCKEEKIINFQKKY